MPPAAEAVNVVDCPVVGEDGLNVKVVDSGEFDWCTRHPVRA